MTKPTLPGTSGMKISYSMKGQGKVQGQAAGPGALQNQGAAQSGMRPSHPDAKALEQKALEHYNAGRLAEALVETRKVLEIDPNQIEAINFAGILHAALGDLETAAALLNDVLQKQPRHFDAANNLGNILARSGQLDQAVEAYQQALKIRPNDEDARHNLAHVREVRDSLDQRVKDARAQIEEDPLAVRPRVVLGMMLLERGRPEEALRAFLTAVRMDPDDIDAHNMLMRLLTEIVPAGYDKDLDGALEWALDSPFTYVNPLAVPIAQHLMLKHDLRMFLGESPQPPDDALIGALDRDPLFLKFLRLVLNTDPGMEKFLTALRARLLHRFADAPQDTPMDLTGALAEQAFLGEYVWRAGDDEIQAVDALGPQALQAIGEGSPGKSPENSEGAGAALLFGLYRSLGELARDLTASPADLPEPAARLVELTAVEPAREEASKSGFDKLGEISDATSSAVRAQYEEHPYPRWAQIPHRPPLDLARDLPRQFVDMEVADYLSGPKDVLVAGCGTGWHPLNIAMLYPESQVLAVDLSTSSLAYAKRMAEKHGIGNIEYMQADILNLGKLDRQFDIVESIGVIHHMAEPEVGWKILAERLRPGGLLKLGLYSEKARQIVLQARERIARDQVPSTTEGIRDFRTGLLDEGMGSGWDMLFQEPDFYTVSTCRDMLFHVQEHRFTIPRIQEAVKATGLKFLGFELSNPAYAELYQTNYPNDKAMRILGNWAALERDMPLVILRYEFWCQKPA